MARGRRKPVAAPQDEQTEVCMTAVLENETVESLEQEMDKVRYDLELIKKELEEKKAELKKMPAREIDADEQKIIDKQISGHSKGEAAKKIIEQQKAYDSVMVTGKFMNRRNPGQAVKLPYIKYESDPVKWWHFEEGKVYTIPRGFADQLNGGDAKNPCYYMPKFTQKEGIMDPNQPGSQIAEVDTTHHKFAFVPTSFT